MKILNHLEIVENDIKHSLKPSTCVIDYLLICMSPVHKSKYQHDESVQFHVAFVQHRSLPHRCLESAITALPQEIIVVLLHLADHLVVALGTGALLGEDFEKLKQGNSLHQGLHFEGKDRSAHPKG